MTWDDICEQTRTDLLEWYNVRDEDVTDGDRQKLADLIAAGRFDSWECPECKDERVYRGDPEEWGDFQGVRQVDYASYPGDAEKYQPEYLAQMCDNCRKGAF